MSALQYPRLEIMFKELKRRRNINPLFVQLPVGLVAEYPRLSHSHLNTQRNIDAGFILM